ncbi:MAG: methyltransferase domain-containing protein [Paracoccaceae bacterium]
MAQYPNEFIDRLHLVWGPGFLSPGGPTEVAKIVEGLELQDKRVLDIGCGTAGPAIVLAREFGAQLICLDVEKVLIDRARVNAKNAGVADQITFHLTQPGPLPFQTCEFDGVFSKEAMLHIPDKAALFADVLRVLKPGGFFAASDWLKGENAEVDPGYQRYITEGHLNYKMATAAETEAAMVLAGFSDVYTVDRQAWYAPLARRELADIEGPLRLQLIAASQKSVYEKWRNSRRGSAAAFSSGSLRPTHLHGVRPAE